MFHTSTFTVEIKSSGIVISILLNYFAKLLFKKCFVRVFVKGRLVSIQKPTDTEKYKGNKNKQLVYTCK